MEVGGVSLYPIPLFCNLIAPMKRSCDLNVCPLCGLWYTCSNFLAVECGHTCHLWCVATYVLSSSNVQLLVVSLHFQSNGVQHGVYKVVQELILVLLPIPLLLDKTTPTHSKIQCFYCFISYFHLLKIFNLVHLKLKS